MWRKSCNIETEYPINVTALISDTEFELRRKRLGSVMPKEEDLHGAAQALIRLQDVYELDIRYENIKEVIK